MANLRIQGDTSGYIDIAAPDVADGSTIDLGQVPQKNQANTFTNTQTIQGSTVRQVINDGAGKGIALGLWDTVNNRVETSGANTLFAQYGDYGYQFTNQSYGKTMMAMSKEGYVTKPNQPSFSAVKNSGNQTITGGSGDVKVTGWSLNSETSNSFSTVDSRFTAPISGRYYVIASIMSSCTGGDYQVKIFKNGSAYVISNDMHTSASTWVQTTVPAVLHLNAGDYVEVYVRNSTTNLIYGASSFTHFHGYLIG